MFRGMEAVILGAFVVSVGGAAMKGLSCFFIVVTMVYVMLSFLGGESFAGAWGIFLADMEKGEIRGFGKRNVGAG
ncbi:hypothetical protein [Bartonella sp. AA78NXGY]|uniref:hypothetical protein n=1 Tax=Bartonella sp. AA78NXGY TaxID=3243437 RepID=UPI0035D021CD